MKIEKENRVTLTPAKEAELPEFQKNLQKAFAVAVVETFGDCDNGPIPPDEVVQESFKASGAVVYHILLDGKKVGGVVLSINKETHHNSLDLLFVFPEYNSHGIGFATWKAIEAKYPETAVWELVTPYFEKRNINFYVNKCGFHIVEFYNEYHPDPHERHDGREDDRMLPGMDAFFRFEKAMKKQI